jgi:hypothetical protein
MHTIILIVRATRSNGPLDHVCRRTTTKVAVVADGKVAEVLHKGSWGGVSEGCEDSEWDDGGSGETHFWMNLFFSFPLLFLGRGKFFQKKKGEFYQEKGGS